MAETMECEMGTCPLNFDPQDPACACCRHNKAPKKSKVSELTAVAFPRCSESCGMLDLLGVGECISVCPEKFPKENLCPSGETFRSDACAASSCAPDQIDLCSAYTANQVRVVE